MFKSKSALQKVQEKSKQITNVFVTTLHDLIAVNDDIDDAVDGHQDQIKALEEQISAEEEQVTALREQQAQNARRIQKLQQFLD